MSHRNRGNALLVCLFMLVVVSLGALVGARGVISGERVVNNFRLEALAQEYAELALRWCESQLVLDDTARRPEIRTMLAEAAVDIAQARWSDKGTWTGQVGLPVPADVPEAELADPTHSSFKPPRRPQCLIETITVAVGATAYLITARGFSPGYSMDSTSGVTRSGAVAWVQSTVAL